MLRGGENGAEIIAGVAESTGRHVAVQEVDVADEGGVVERGLIRSGPAAADQGAGAVGPVFVELITKRRERRCGQCCDGTADAVQDVALEQLTSSFSDRLDA
ncbi:hypothetical protein JEY40_34840 [Bradyrhizobium japonicum]|nr:hypothetical protein JEY40_34840 [Bradyrhizobium japonicum]